MWSSMLTLPGNQPGNEHFEGGEELPAARRRLDQVCGPGYLGRKRVEVVRTRSTVLQMHSQQWRGTYSRAGNGDYREELKSACRAICTYLDTDGSTLQTAPPW